MTIALHLSVLGARCGELTLAEAYAEGHREAIKRVHARLDCWAKQFGRKENIALFYGIGALG